MKKQIYFFLLLILSLNAKAESAVQDIKQFQKKPNLVVLLVIDQFRADYLTRFHNKFLSAKKSNGQLGGFQFLMENSAYFPFAVYDVFQNMTCPGHAMISTGSRPYANGIPLNDNYDRQLKKMVYCAEDVKYEISPLKLKTTTFSDEYKNAGFKSKVFSVALKDRSAVMLGGHRADYAFWMDYSKFRWETSSYYSDHLPDWLVKLNQNLITYDKKTVKFQNSDFKILSKQGLSLSHGIDLTFSLAESILKNEKLGLNSQTDFLAISLSTHDMLGHKLGLNSQEMQELTIYEDQRLSDFLNQLQKHLGSLNNVEIFLTADHGVAPTVEYSQNAKLDAGKLDYLDIYKVINKRLDDKFGEAKNKSWIAASKSLHLYFDQDILNSKKIKVEDVENEAKLSLKNMKGIFTVVTHHELLNQKYPPGVLGEQMRKQFVPEKSGDLIIIPEPFYMEKDDNLTTHMTAYSYDKTVPLILFGSKFKKGVYSSEALVIDLAPTINFSLGIIPPARNEGKVLPIFK